jgi:AbrB family looped-hinge helix DNA binding protein
MIRSTVTGKGQTTIPGKVRKALRIRPGDRLEYTLQGDTATIRVHPGVRSVIGALASKKGKCMSFPQIREEAAKAALRPEGIGRTSGPRFTKSKAALSKRARKGHRPAATTGQAKAAAPVS